MEKIDLDMVTLAANLTRHWAEEVASSEITHAKEKHDSITLSANMEGMCARASAHLHKKLTSLGIPNVIVHTYSGSGGHCFIRVQNHVVDVTATQFPGQSAPVVIKPMSEQEMCKPYWTRDYVEFTNVKDFKHYVSKWPIEQRKGI